MQTQASKEANEIIEPKKLTIREKVYNFIQENPRATISDISKGLNIAEKTISGRLSELLDSARVSIVGIKKGLSEYIVATPNHFDIMVRRSDKFNSKIKQLEKNYPDLLGEYIKNKLS